MLQPSSPSSSFWPLQSWLIETQINTLTLLNYDRPPRLALSTKNSLFFFAAVVAFGFATVFLATVALGLGFAAAAVGEARRAENMNPRRAATMLRIAGGITARVDEIPNGFARIPVRINNLRAAMCDIGIVERSCKRVQVVDKVATTTISSTIMYIDLFTYV